LANNRNKKKRRIHIKRSWLSFERRKSLEGFIFTIPWIIGLIIFLLIPLIMSVKISFYKTNLMHLMGGTFVGLDNYARLIKEPANALAILVAIRDSVTQVPIIIGFSLFVAVLLKQEFPGRVLFRIIFFVPVILAGVIMSYLFNDDVGSMSVFSQVTNQNNLNFLSQLGIVDQLGTIMWRSSVEILIFLAALQSVPKILYEVVELDGATAWESFWHVTLPYISPFVILNVIYGLVDSFIDPKNPVMGIFDTLAKSGTDFGLASALSWFYLLLSLIVILIFLLFSRRWLR